MKNFLIIILILISFSFSDPYAIKRISDNDFRYEFYTTSKKIKPEANKMYYWFKGGLIHCAQSGVAGDLLNDKFTKMYHSNQLAEQGEFRNGLKIGLWKTWHPNGIVKTSVYWRNGLKTGIFYSYDENGAMIEHGNYKRDIKHGKWVNFEKKETLTYREGHIFFKKIKLSKEEKAKLKREEKAKKKLEKEVGKENKKGFFKRLFSKKEDKKETIQTKESKEGFFKRLFGKKQSNLNNG